MKKVSRMVLLALGAAALSACATTPVGPVEVTRFHQSARAAQLGQTTIFIEDAPGQDTGSLELAPYKAAVARELAKLGYREVARRDAAQIAQVSLEREVSEPAPKRSPVSVGAGIGGGTGGYRSGGGVGLGIGINLGGNKPSQLVATQLAVSIREVASTAVLWEGRAGFSVGIDSPLAIREANASTMAGALFREFPGNNGETIEVKVKTK